LLLATTLRRLGEIDDVLGAMIERPLEGANASAGRSCGWAPRSSSSSARRATPRSTLGAARRARLPHLKGLANAVLRRVAREGVAMLGDRDPARLNTPQWLWESWSASYGEDATRAIAAAHLIEAPLDLTPRADADFWAGRSRRRSCRPARCAAPPAATSPNCRATPRAPGGCRTPPPPCPPPAGRRRRQARRRSLRRAGRQDAAALRRRRARHGGRHLRAARCALARTSRAPACRRAGDADASKWTPAEKFDAILLDAPAPAPAPCAAIPTSLAQRTRRCRRLTLTSGPPALHALDLLKPGGTLVYAVCSLQEDEGPARIDACWRERLVQRCR
jgi:16S rRNA (cytosine967-C5)-methyltransferase